MLVPGLLVLIFAKGDAPIHASCSKRLLMNAPVFLIGAVLASVASFAAATTYTVTNTGDNGGTNPAVHAGTGTLRQAIVDSNADGGLQNLIQFNISGTGPFDIAITSGKPLPFITSNVSIDGFSQTGTIANTHTPDDGGLDAHLMIEIDGGNAVGYGFYVNAAVSAGLAGLVIDGFSSDAIEQNFAGSTLLVFGCYIGTQADGSAFPSGFGNGGVAIRIDAGQANIGGTLPGQRNLISGNAGGGIVFIGSATGVVEGNLIGTDASGAVAIGGGASSNWPGIIVPGNVSTVRIGCTGATCNQAGHPSRNVVSGNHEYGIGIWDSFGSGDSGGLQIKGNFIGTDVSGTKPVPNGDATGGCPQFCGGIQLQVGSAGAPATIIGGLNPGEGNLIAYNHGPAIVPAQGSLLESFDLGGNAIHNNQFADIEFNLAAGRVANDAGDADTGSNNQQNFPVIESASVSGGNLTVTYHVDSTTANAKYPLRVDFYVNADEGSGEYLASDSYPASSAQLSRMVSLPLPADAQSPAGFVATATTADGYSSEFSPSHVFDRIFQARFEAVP